MKDWTRPDFQALTAPNTFFEIISITKFTVQQLIISSTRLPELTIVGLVKRRGLDKVSNWMIDCCSNLLSLAFHCRMSSWVGMYNCLTGEGDYIWGHFKYHQLLNPRLIEKEIRMVVIQGYLSSSSTDAQSNQCLNKKENNFYTPQSCSSSSRFYDCLTPKLVEHLWTMYQSPSSLESFNMQTKVSTIVSYIYELMYVTCLSIWNLDESHNLLHIFPNVYPVRIWQLSGTPQGKRC